MKKEILSQFELGDMLAIYIINRETDTVGFTIIPKSLEGKFTLAGNWEIESLVQTKLIGDDYPIGFSNGRTLRNSETAIKMKFVEQCVALDGTIITTMQKDSLVAKHIVIYKEEQKGIEVQTRLKNIGNREVGVELLSSFSICSLFAFSTEERTKDFNMFRLRSRWSEEGRLEKTNFLEVQLEPSWQKYGVQCIRYGQIGTMPVREFFPWIVLEDEKTNCMVGAMISYAGSWQMELYSKDDRPAFSGGLADREFGHWVKNLKPGESVDTPYAYISTCVGNIDDISHRLVSIQEKSMATEKEIEYNLPIIFNEFCTTWGKPSEEKMQWIINQLKGKGITYFVIDAGWYADPIKGWESTMGDWEISPELFPEGIEKTVELIRKNGMIPGIWFEIETIGKEANAYSKEDMLLKRDGVPITTGKRRFWDLRQREVQEYLDKKVISFLKKYQFGYLKVDYNDNIGIGCDGAESLGEGLREQVVASQTIFKKIKGEVPSIVIENCSSGGHRLEPSMMEITSMSSFSDAHECISIPIIAANLHRAVLPAKSQIWAVLRTKDNEKRLYYSMINTFLGRMCLSGDIVQLSKKQWKVVEAAIYFYKSVTDIIKYGQTYRYGTLIKSYAHPEGWQGIVRKYKNKILVIVHNFYENNMDLKIKLNLQASKFSVIEKYGRENVVIQIKDSEIIFANMEELEAIAILIEREGE